MHQTGSTDLHLVMVVGEENEEGCVRVVVRTCFVSVYAGVIFIFCVL